MLSRRPWLFALFDTDSQYKAELKNVTGNNYKVNSEDDAIELHILFTVQAVSQFSFPTICCHRNFRESSIVTLIKATSFSLVT